MEASEILLGSQSAVCHISLLTFFERKVMAVFIQLGLVPPAERLGQASQSFLAKMENQHFSPLKPAQWRITACFELPGTVPRLRHRAGSLLKSEILLQGPRAMFFPGFSGLGECDLREDAKAMDSMYCHSG